MSDGRSQSKLSEVTRGKIESTQEANNATSDYPNVSKKKFSKFKIQKYIFS